MDDDSLSQAMTTSNASQPHGSEGSDAYLLVEEKTFTCTHPGCKKRFTRAEHMQRHALNHMPGGLTCDLCSAHFKRPDLLKRHMDRHRQKDLEAGGPGCGVLDTRKRSWKASDGSVVEKRPCPYPPPSRGRASSGRARPRAQQVPSPEPEPADVSRHSPPSYLDAVAEQDYSGNRSTSSETHAHTAAELGGTVGRGALFHAASSDAIGNTASVGFPPALQLHDFITADSHFDLDAAQSNYLGEPSFASEQLDYDQIFQPDTASSFNMPYTTALDYNWLFNMQDTSEPVIQPRTSNQDFDAPIVDRQPAPRAQTNVVITPESMSSAQLWTEPTDATPRDKGRRVKPPGVGPNAQSAPAPEPARRNLDMNPRDRNMNSESMASRRRIVADAPVASRPQRYTAIGRSPPPEPERPLSSLRKPLNIPDIDENVRERLLGVIDAAKPCLPDQRHTIWEHPLLSAESLKSYLELFFTRFNTAYPLIHLETFDCTKTEPLLMLSILLLGATYSSKDCHQLAVCIHDVIRPSIFAHAGFSPRPELWTLQTILLVECFGKSRAGQKQHDMSHLFHGLLINLIRRSDCQSVRPVGPPPASADENAEALHPAWKRWADAEQKKRLALLCFMWDTQHAVLFCQSLCMSAFELRLELPCSQTVWEARDATSWAAAWRSTGGPGDQQQRTFYLAILKSYLTPSAPRPTGLSGFTRVLVLHGLMSVAWDMGRRDQTALGVVSGVSGGGGGGGGGSGWRGLLSAAYDAWKTDFDAYCSNFSAQLRAQRHPQSQSQSHVNPAQDADDEARRLEFEAFAAAFRALYHAAQALLNMEFLDVQIYAGARHILGRPVQQRDYLRSAQVVKRWASAAAASAAGASGNGAGTGERQDQGRGAGHLGRGRRDASMSAEQSAAQPEQSSSTAAWHAARMLRETRRSLTSAEAMNLFHVPWCLYLATLTCWAYHHARPNHHHHHHHHRRRCGRTSYAGLLSSSSSLSRRGFGPADDEFDEGEGDYMGGAGDEGEEEEDDDDDDEMIWDPRGEMEALVASMSERAERSEGVLRRERRRTNGLVWIMADILTTVRWGIVHAGVVVLRGLVPQRLINQYEEAV